MSDAQARKGEFTGRHMLVFTLGFFGIVIAVNVGMAVVSQTSWTGLVVENSYVASPEFEEKRIAHDRQVAAGWESRFTYAGGVATLLVRDGAGNAVDLGPVSLLINRPVGGHDDANLTPARAADGSYAAPVALGEGVWEAMATASTDTGPYELHVRFKVGDAEAEIATP